MSEQAEPLDLGDTVPVSRAFLESLARSRETKQDRDVYFVLSSATGLIKIGVADKAGKRLRQLAMQSADGLKIVGLMRCHAKGALEKKFHAQFAADRMHGEWFRQSADLWMEIECYGLDNYSRMLDCQEALSAPTKRSGPQPKCRMGAREAYDLKRRKLKLLRAEVGDRIRAVVLGHPHPDITLERKAPLHD